MRYLDAADRGDLQAMFLVSVSLTNGSEGRRDPYEAAQWARRAAERGHAQAQLHLGTLYGRGIGVPQSVHEAKGWYALAAQAGLMDAKANLARILTDAGDHNGALPLWQEIARTGDAEALFFVAYAHQLGLGTGIDGAVAVDFYRRSANAGNDVARFNLGKMLFDGDLVQGDFRAAYECFKPLADKGDAHAAYYLGGILFNGWGVAADHAQAARYTRQAADAGIARAQHQLASLYSSGMGVPQSNSQAQYWLQRSQTNPDQSRFG